MLTIQILTNEKPNYEPDFPVEVLVGSPVGDRAATRNRLLKQAANDWQLVLEDWEKVESWEAIAWAVAHSEEDAYNLHIIQKTLITKECRLFRRSAGRKFNVEGVPLADNNLDCYLRSENKPPPVLEEVLKSGNSYYIAQACLALRDYKRFVSFANKFLFEGGDTLRIVNTHYWLALVYYEQKNYEEVINHALVCLAAHPCMAEYWCLLADLFVRMGQYRRAVALYENAIVMGSRRKMDDLYSIQPELYKSYPEKMIGAMGSNAIQ